MPGVTTPPKKTESPSDDVINTVGKVQPSTCFNETCPPSVEDLKAVEGAWVGEDLKKSKFWGLEFTEEELAEMDVALQHVKADPDFELRFGWQPMNITKENFPLGPGLAQKMQDIAEELENGAGAVMVKNMPVKKYSSEDLGIIYAGINAYIGVWVPQSSAGLRSESRGYGLPLGKVCAEMCGNTPQGGKQANNYFRLHTDRCDIITLVCIRKSVAGGLSRIASAKQIHNIMMKEHPEECARLYKPYTRIWEGSKCYVDLPVWSIENGKFTTQVSPSYIENAQVLSEVPKLDEMSIEAVDLIEEIGCANALEFMMDSGMVYWLNNHMVYHGRDSWRFQGEEEKTAGRLLLRQWISPYNSRALPDTEMYRHIWGSTEAGVERGGLGPAIKSGLTEKHPELVKAISAGTYDYYGLYKRRFGLSAEKV